MAHKHRPDQRKIKRTPLWKWIVIIFLIVGMPLFFSFVRSSQMQTALTPQPSTAESAEKGTNPHVKH